jgi:gp16 family phage-associated protein
MSRATAMPLSVGCSVLGIWKIHHDVFIFRGYYIPQISFHQAHNSQLPTHSHWVIAKKVIGIRVNEWAREKEFCPALVYSVVAGERKCLRGMSLKIAKELGMK